jgi:DNA-directed RNA polymerase subunit RPC12/RpoP
MQPADLTTIDPQIEKANRFHCSSCGADLLFEPKDGCLTCPYCGHRESIPQTSAEIVERSYEEFLKPQDVQLQRLAVNALQVQCTSCGATVTFTPPEVARQCDFCGAPIVAQPKAADPIVAPEALLPFKVTQPESHRQITTWISSRWFAPNALKRLASQQGVKGVYIPFWTYDAQTVSLYSGERGEHYYTTETYTETDSQGNTETKTRQVQHTAWYPASGTVARFFDDLLVPATESLPKRRLDALEPWDLAELKPYDPAYLSGYRAQRYQIDLPGGFEIAKSAMEPVIEEDARRDIGGDEQRVHSIKTSYSTVTFKHLLLPVYVGAYHFNSKLYQVVVNGRTGEVQGERPYSAIKIALLVASIVLVLMFLVLVFGSRG